MSKAISTVIATLLMLIITIALVGFSYTFISGVVTSRTATVFSVVDTFGDTVTVRNDGTVAIESMTASLNVKPLDAKDFSIIPEIAAAPDPAMIAYWSFDEEVGLR